MWWWFFFACKSSKVKTDEHYQSSGALVLCCHLQFVIVLFTISLIAQLQCKYTLLLRCMIILNTESVAELRDVLLYASHPDPQLKGNTSVIIGNFIAVVLTEGRGSFYSWMKQHNVHDKGLLVSLHSF